MYKWKNHFKQMSFLNKIRLIYSMLLMIPILVLECFVLSSSSNFIREQQILETEETIGRNYQDIQNQMSQCEKSVLYLVSNNTLKEFLNTEDKEYLMRTRMSKNVGPLLYNSLMSNQYFTKLQVYSEKNFAVSNDLFKEAKEIEGTGWYRESLKTSKTMWWYEDGEFFLTKRVVDDYPGKPLAVLKVEVKASIFEESFEMFSKMPVEITMEDGKSSYTYTNVRDGHMNQIGYEEKRSLGESEWDITYQVGADNFSSIFHPRMLISLIIVCILLVAAWIGVNYCTKSLLKYLYRLIGDVKRVKEGNFEIQVDESSQDEIGELAESINQMLRKIQMLIDEVYKFKLDKKSLELNLLQSKINPHFLYNNLSAINWIAIENEEDKIYEITTQMATFYRTALNKGVNIDKLGVEIENIKAYISLQLIAHDESFDVGYNIPENLLEVDIPIFIMQPLVENAIEHGIDTQREGRGCIQISINPEEHVLNIEIKDTGKKLFEKIGSGQMDVKDYGYGVSNVNKRIQLLCGEAYGVIIYADETGTTSQIRVKKDSIILERKS